MAPDQIELSKNTAIPVSNRRPTAPANSDTAQQNFYVDPELVAGEIALPVFNLEAAGGSGPGMAGTLDRLVSADVTRHVAQLHPQEDAWLDFGHVDLFTAGNAEVLAWEPTLSWIEDNMCREAVEPPEYVACLNVDDLEGLRLLCTQAPTVAKRYDYPTDRYIALSAEIGNLGIWDSNLNVRWRQGMLNH